MELTLFRSLLRVRQELKARPALWRGIRNGVIRHTQRSQAWAQLQEEATSATPADASDAFRRSLPAGALLPAMANLDKGMISDVGIDNTFTTLRCLSDLLAAITKVSTGVNLPFWRAPLLDARVCSCLAARGRRCLRTHAPLIRDPVRHRPTGRAP